MSNRTDNPGNGATKPLRRVQKPVKLAQKAYDEIRIALLTGGEIAEDRFSEDDLAKALSVSRTPVREALHRLALVGLIEPAQPAGYTRRRTTLRGIHEHCELRLLLDPRAAELAARETADREELLAELSAKAKPTNPVEEAEFHTAIALAAADVSLPALIGELTDLAGLDEAYLERTAGTMPIPRPGHDALMLAFEQGDPAAAGRAMTEHLEQVRDRMVDTLEGLLAKDRA